MSVVSGLIFNVKHLPRLCCCLVEKKKWKKTEGEQKKLRAHFCFLCLLYCKWYSLKGILNFMDYSNTKCIFSVLCASAWHSTLFWCSSSMHSAALLPADNPCVVCVGGFGESMQLCCQGHGCCEERTQRCWERAPRCRLWDIPPELQLSLHGEL